MPRVPYRQRRNKAYRTLLVATVRLSQVPPYAHDKCCAPYGVTACDVEQYQHELDWRQLKYTLDCLVKEGLAFKTTGRRGVKCRYWPVGGLQMINARERRRT